MQKLKRSEDKILDHVKYINTREFDKLTRESFTKRLKRAKI